MRKKILQINVVYSFCKSLRAKPSEMQYSSEYQSWLNDGICLMRAESIAYGMKALKDKCKTWKLSSFLVFGLFTALFGISANKQWYNIVFFKSATGELLASL